MLTASLRFLPYVGIWLSALFPFCLALAVFPGWGPALLVLALYGGFDIVMTNVVEPLLFGHGTGVSSMALVLAAVFWAFLWGPIGLLLAVPLTVCLVVLGEHVPSLSFIRILLGDAPAVDPGALFFHRALVGDYDSAAVLIGEQSNAPLVEVYGQVLLPALVQAKMERERGNLDTVEERRVYRTARAVLSGVLAARRPTELSADAVEGPGPVVIGCAAHGLPDQVTIGMLRDLVVGAGGEMVIVPASKLVEEVARRVRAGRVATVCIATIAPGGLSRAARLCEQMRAGKTGSRVVIGRWGFEPDVNSAEKFLKSAGASLVTRTLAETLHEVGPDEPSAPPPEPVTALRPASIGA